MCDLLVVMFLFSENSLIQVQFQTLLKRKLPVLFHEGYDATAKNTLFLHPSLHKQTKSNIIPRLAKISKITSEITYFQGLKSKIDFYARMTFFTAYDHRKRQIILWVFRIYMSS